jgi:hypothetical protein
LKTSLVIGQPWQWGGGVSWRGWSQEVANPNVIASLKISCLHLTTIIVLDNPMLHPHNTSNPN